MKCIVCDRCKKIIEDQRHCRVITCARPLKFEPNAKTTYRGNDPQMNDIIWTKEVCSDCLDELEQFFEAASDTVQVGDSSDEGTDGESGSDSGSV